MSSLGFTPVRSAHPVRAKNDGDGQVSWLAGQRRFGPPSQDLLIPMACGPMAHRSQLQGQPGLLPRSHFHRSEEHTSELQSLMRISYAVFCLKKKKQNLKEVIQKTVNKKTETKTHK